MRLAKFCLALALTVGLAPKTETANADSSSWRGVENIAGWEAVGRLTISGKTMCTGALVAPDLVLTAAHCLYNPVTGSKVRPDRITFQAGLQNGRAKAERAVVSASAHPDYRHRTKGAAQVGHDLALLRLSSPIGAQEVVPLAFEGRPEKGDILSVIAYTVGNRHDPQMAYPCQVVARKKATLVMNCEVDFGASGAPVFALQNGQRPYLVSVISAKAEMKGRDVSVGTSLDPSVLRMLVSNS